MNTSDTILISFEGKREEIDLSIERVREVVMENGGEFSINEEGNIEIKKFDMTLIDELGKIEIPSEDLKIDIKLLV